MFLTRCYTKANGNFSGDLKHHLVSYQLDGLEMVPLNHGSLLCHGNDSPVAQGICERADVIKEQVQVNSDSTSSQNSESGTGQEMPGTNYSRGELEAQCNTSQIFTFAFQAFLSYKKVHTALHCFSLAL